MKISIRCKFILSYILLALLIVVTINTYGHARIFERLVEKEQIKLYNQAELIARDYITSLDILNTSDAALRNQFISMQNLTDMRVWIVGPTGTILMDSNIKNSVQGKNINRYDSSFLSKQGTVGTYPKGLLTKSVIAEIYPLTENLSTIGYIVMMTPADILSHKAAQYIDTILLCYFIVLGVFAAILVYLYYQTVLPLRSMAKAAKRYADGDIDYKLDKMPSRDYEKLASAIKYLAERMNSLTDYQKNFIANVSHDFRSPLTSIKGYTEALADGTIPIEMQEKYIKIILFEVDRLTKLTSNLLELNQFENRGSFLEITDFDINQAIRDTSASFERRCTAKKISLNLIFDQKELYVSGDLNKLQQVIQNLIDNAIKFSHNDSTIEVHTSLQNHKIFVSVKDRGIGIPKDNIHKIWSRFYKTDLSRGKDKTGTGLGLSITKEIIDAHGENINVISTEGVGTEFIFSLPEGIEKKN